jgi:adenylate cyclase
MIAWLRQKKFPWIWFSPILIYGLVFFAGHTAIIRRFEWNTLDWRTRLRAHFQPPPDPRIAVIIFDDDTENRIGQPWPVDRALHASLVQLLALAHASVVTWDVILDSDRSPEGDAQLAAMANAARSAGTQVITAAVSSEDPTDVVPGQEGPTRPLPKVTGDIAKLSGDERAILPFSGLRNTSWYGFADTPPGPDGMRREIPLVVRIGRQVYPSLSLQTLLVYFGVKVDDVTVRLGDAVYFPVAGQMRRVPISDEGKYTLNYRYDSIGNPTDFSPFGYGQLLIALTEHFQGKKVDGPPPPDLKGRIVFIGQAVTGKADVGPTPLASLTPLVLIHANLVNNVLAFDFARSASPWLVWPFIIGLGYIGVWMGLRRSLVASTLFTFAGILFIVSAASVAWIAGSISVPLVVPVIGFAGLQFVTIGQRMLTERRGKEQVKRMFSSYLSPDLLKKVLHEKGVMAVGGERKPVTILFSDLRGFTSWSEKTREDVLIAQLNEYLGAMVACIHAHGGTLHKFIGDAVMAVWGDLISEGPVADANKACRAALAMKAHLDQLNAQWAAHGRHTLQMGIGLNHGNVIVGNVGSPQRMEFTVIGDSVNLASRLEGLTKEYDATIIVGESIIGLVGEYFAIRSLGHAKIKGKFAGVLIFELCGEI